MSESVTPVVAGIKRPRTAKFAAFAAVAGLLGSAGFAVGSAPWAKAAEAPKPAHVQLDAFRSATTAGTAAFSHGAAHHAAQPAVDKTKPAAAKPAAMKTVKPKAAHAKPYAIYDSVTPSSLPDGKAAAVYTNGAYAASGSQVAGHKSVLWIDTNGSNPSANVLDVEPGDATPAGAAAWVQQRLDKHHDSVAIVYTMRSAWQDVKDHVSHLPKPMQDNVRYWIADPTGVEHNVPGADATQWYWGKSIDISKANPSLTQTK
jgi:hypothetical protein